jgi:high-affinity nickel-transport protein
MSAFLRAFTDQPGGLAARIISIYTVLLAANVAAWTWAFVVFHNHPILLGTCFLAYSFGLRHAVDADHIAAIDNVTRKLMQEGKQPLTVGLFFSLGHSTVVILATLGIALASAAFKHQLEGFRAVGSLIGVSVSAAFLLVIAAINLIILVNVYKTFQRVKQNGTYVERNSTSSSRRAGFSHGSSGDCFAPLDGARTCIRWAFCLAWLRYATEIGLLAIAATEGVERPPDLVDPGVPGPVHRRHDADRHDQQRHDGWRLRLGIREAGAQTLFTT